MFCLFFFFKQKTAYEMRISDWSSDVCSSDLEGDFPERNQHEADGEHLQRGQAVMRQHLVADIPEEERRGETEQVEREGNQQHFADQFPVFDDLGNEPGHVEGGAATCALSRVATGSSSAGQGEIGRAAWRGRG